MAAETTTSVSWVQKTPGVCGGDACVRNTSITVHGSYTIGNSGSPMSKSWK